MPSLKRHDPKTVRLNTGADYRGCLRVSVLGSASLLAGTEGLVRGMQRGLAPAAPGRMQGPSAVG